jgi:hypothetical protein
MRMDALAEEGKPLRVPVLSPTPGWSILSRLANHAGQASKKPHFGSEVFLDTKTSLDVE